MQIPMTQIRTYKDQFKASDIKKIEFIFKLIEQLKNQKAVAKFYCQELRCSLVGGSILGGLLISFSIMEMIIIDNYVLGRLGGDEKKYGESISELEIKKTHINVLLDESVKSNSINESDAETLKELYKNYRIPLGHGLRTKGLYESPVPKSFLELFSEKDSGPIPVSWKAMESIIEKRGLEVITSILKIVGASLSSKEIRHNSNAVDGGRNISDLIS